MPSARQTTRYPVTSKATSLRFGGDRPAVQRLTLGLLELLVDMTRQLVGSPAVH